MGRGRGKGKKQPAAIAARDDTGSGDDEKLPVRRRGRPQKPLKDDVDEEDEVVKIEDEGDEDGEEAKGNKNGRKRKMPTQIKESSSDLVTEENNGIAASTTVIIKNVGYRQNGSRRKNKPRRAAEVGVECK